MTYTINGKEWTELDINKRCAELMNLTVLALQDVDDSSVKVHPGFNFCPSEVDFYNPCNNPADTDAIIDKCLNELMSVKYEYCVLSRWQYLMHQHKCTKLVAACICFIEINEGKL
jgi:hypothetical protein